MNGEGRTMLTEELDYTFLKRVFNDENSQTPATQRFNKLLKENGINFEVCLSREDNHLYMYTRLFNTPLFKSRYTCNDSNNWVSSQTKLIPLYKVLKTFSSDIKHGKFEFSTKLELAFVYDEKFNVKLEFLENSDVKVSLTYYRKRNISSYEFDVYGGRLTVSSNGWGGSNSFCYELEEVVSLKGFSKFTLITLRNKVTENMKQLGYEI